MKNLKTFLLLFNLAFLSISAQEAATNKVTMSIDSDSSSLKWIGEKITTSQHYGSLKFLSGDLSFCNDKDKVGDNPKFNLEAALICSGNFTVDMTSLLVEDLTGSSKERLEGHLKSDDFFSVNKHEKAYLSIENSKVIDSGFLVNGSLTIKDIIHPIEFRLVRAPRGFVANLVFDRSKYNVKYNSGSFFENLGDKLILDEIELTANLYF